MTEGQIITRLHEGTLKVEVPSEDLKDPDKRKGLSMYFFAVIYHSNYGNLKHFQAELYSEKL